MFGAASGIWPRAPIGCGRAAGREVDGCDGGDGGRAAAIWVPLGVLVQFVPEELRLRAGRPTGLVSDAPPRGPFGAVIASWPENCPG